MRTSGLNPRGYSTGKKHEVGKDRTSMAKNDNEASAEELTQRGLSDLLSGR